MLGKSFIGNHGLKMYGFRDTGCQSQWWCHHISNGYSYFSRYVNLCTVNFTPIKIFLGQRRTVLVKEGGPICSFNNLVHRTVSKRRTALGTNLHFQRFHIPMKRVDWNKYFSLLIMISFLRAVAKNYVNWRGRIPAIIFQSFYCRVTWENIKRNTSNALNS